MKPTTRWSLFRIVFEILGSILAFLRSNYALFGLRAALAGLTAAIPAYLQNSAMFYRSYRGVWSTIVIVISLGPTTGASVYGLLFQCLGTILGGLTSMAVWYVVDQKVPGVIVLSFFVTIVRMNVVLQN